jgi:hypothetical protein
VDRSSDRPVYAGHAPLSGAREPDLEYRIADGTLIGADVVLQQLDRAGTLLREAGLPLGLGPGDGGRPATAAVNYPNGVAAVSRAVPRSAKPFRHDRCPAAPPE